VKCIIYIGKGETSHILRIQFSLLRNSRLFVKKQVTSSEI